MESTARPTRAKKLHTSLHQYQKFRCGHAYANPWVVPSTLLPETFGIYLKVHWHRIIFTHCRHGARECTPPNPRAADCILLHVHKCKAELGDHVTGAWVTMLRSEHPNVKRKTVF